MQRLADAVKGLQRRFAFPALNGAQMRPADPGETAHDLLRQPALLPQPPAKKGQIHTNTADELWVDIEKISDKQYADYVQACQTVGFTVDAESNSSSFGAYNAYVSACRDKGFTVDYNKGDNYYRANNDAGWQVSIDYVGNQIMSIRIDAPDTSSGSTTSEPSPDSSTSSATAQNDGKLVNGMRKDFKEAMDSYEAFMNEYVAFMKKYNANPNDPTLMADYARYMSKYADACEKFNQWESADMNDAETAYYIDVQARVSKKLLEVAG